MATLNTRNFNTAVQTFAAAVQGRSDDLVDFSVGSILLAFAEAVCSDEMWLQGLFAQTLATTRLSTCFGTDVDTFCAQYMPVVPGTVSAALPAGTPRLQGVAATALLSFYRNTPSQTSPFVPVGASAKTPDGTQQFVVYADPTNPNYSAAANGYYMPPMAAAVLGSGNQQQPGVRGRRRGGDDHGPRQHVPERRRGRGHEPRTCRGWVRPGDRRGP